MCTENSHCDEAIEAGLEYTELQLSAQLGLLAAHKRYLAVLDSQLASVKRSMAALDGVILNTRAAVARQKLELSSRGLAAGLPQEAVPA